MTEYSDAQIDERLLLRALAPRPLVWVTTNNADGSGLNLAPFSAVTIVAADPPTLLLIIQRAEQGYHKRTTLNILASDEFIVNAPSRTQLDSLMRSADPNIPHDRRCTVAEVATSRGTVVDVDRFVGASYALECKVLRHDTIGRADLFFAAVVHLHDHAKAATPCQPFLGTLGYEWFVSETGVSFVPQPYLAHVDT